MRAPSSSSATTQSPLAGRAALAQTLHRLDQARRAERGVDQRVDGVGVGGGLAADDHQRGRNRG